MPQDGELSVRFFKEGYDKEYGRFAPGKTPTFGEFIGKCSSVHVWNLVLVTKVDDLWFQMYAGTFQGREMLNVDQLAGKEIKDLLNMAERYVITEVEAARRDLLWQTDASRAWLGICDEFLATGRCMHRDACYRVHCKQRTGR